MGKTPKWVADMPKVVKIDAYDYRVEVMNKDYAEGAGILGEIRNTELVIKLRIDRGYRIAALTLDHEIAHGVCYHGGVASRVAERVILWTMVPESSRLCEDEFMGKLEELIVERVNDGRHATQRDNPGAYRWIQRGIERG